MTIPETDVGKLLALFKHQGTQIDRMMLLIKDMQLLNEHDTDMISRQTKMIADLSDEIAALTKRVEKLEKVIGNVQS